MNEKLPDYLKEYNDFIVDYKSGITNAETVGILIAKMAQNFSVYNVAFAKADFAYCQKASVIENTDDPNTLKPISSAKAKVLAEATSEHEQKILLEVHVKNIDTILQSAKALQKSLLQEHALAAA